jgi:hypothetical protein
MRRLGGKPLKINNNSSGDEHRHGAVLINFDVPRGAPRRPNTRGEHILSATPQ